MRRSVYSAFIKIDDKLLYLLSIKAKNALLDKIMPKITRCNDYGIVFLLFATIILWEDSFKSFISVLLALTLGLICGEDLIKHVIKRNRPECIGESYTFLVKMPVTFSFPSGHTTSSFAVLGVAWYLNLQFKYLIWVLAVLISFSRIYLHVHYPSDITGGIILGFFCSVITLKTLGHIGLIKSLIVDTSIGVYSVKLYDFTSKCFQNIFLCYSSSFLQKASLEYCRYLGLSLLYI